MKVKLVNADIKFNYVEELLRERGVDNVENFLQPGPEHLQSWLDLDNIEEGIQLLEKTIGEGGKTLLIVD